MKSKRTGKNKHRRGGVKMNHMWGEGDRRCGQPCGARRKQEGKGHRKAIGFGDRSSLVACENKS